MTGPGRLALGTAQLGMEYGVANRSGRPETEEALAILERALDGGVRWFDTAQSYGAAERLLGELARRHPGESLAVVTKLAPGLDLTDSGAVTSAVRASAEILGRPLAAVLIHDPAGLAAWNRGLGETLAACREEGLTEAAGASVYGPEQFALAAGLEGIGLVEVGFNVFDQRIDGGLAATARELGVRLILRSVFLQGVLLMDAGARPPWLGFAAERLAAWQAVCARHGASPAATALRFALTCHPDALVAVGCERSEQLEAALAAAAEPPLDGPLLDELAALATEDRRLIDPTQWPV